MSLQNPRKLRRDDGQIHHSQVIVLYYYITLALIILCTSTTAVLALQIDVLRASSHIINISVSNLILNRVIRLWIELSVYLHPLSGADEFSW